ncbi:hypothetical protein ACEQ8H_008897 [Pleosporales sp. CAS-2024a]
MEKFGSPTPLSAAEKARRKRRRYQSRSDEEIESEMDNRGLSYRYGWPQLPHLPVDTIRDGAMKSVHNAAEHLQTLNDILDAQRISVSSIFFAYRVPNNAIYDEPKEAFHTAFASVNTIGPTTIVTAVIKMRQYLKTHEETKDILIEVIDWRAMYGLPSFHIPHKETAIREAWDQVSKIVETEIYIFDEKWLSMELLNRGLTEEKSSPTVVIATPSVRNDAWIQTIVPAIRKKLSDLALTIDVELLCATTLLLVESAKSAPSIESYETSTMACSIGFANDEKHAATVGGFVTLSDGKTYGLTNHHVVRDDVVDEVIETTTEKYLMPGQIEKSTDPRRFNSPADCDHAYFMESMRDAITSWEEQKNWGNRNAAAHITRFQNDMEKASQCSRDFGSLFASSGLRLMTRPEMLPRSDSAQPKAKAASSDVNFLLDWALLQIAPSRSVGNELPERAITRDRKSTKLIEGIVCRRWTPLDSGKTNIKTEKVEVIKYGRTTGCTFGSIKSSLTKINPETDSVWEELGRVYKLNRLTVGACYSIVKPRDYVFVSPGDSGSIIMHADTGAWLGLLFGQSATGNGLMLPMDLIIDDIEHVTGLTVTEPQLETFESA